MNRFFDQIPAGADMPPQDALTLYQLCTQKEFPLADGPLEENDQTTDLESFLEKERSAPLYEQLIQREYPKATEPLDAQDHTTPLEEVFPQNDEALDCLRDAISRPKSKNEQVERMQNAFSQKAEGISTLKDVNMKIKVIDGIPYVQFGPTWYKISESDFATLLDSNMPEVSDELSPSATKNLYKKITHTASIRVTRDDLERSPNLIPCTDGVYDVLTGQTYDSDLGKDFFYRVNIRIGEIKKGQGNCYEEYLEKSFGTAEDAIICYEQCQGVILSGLTPRKIFLYGGPTGCGKSVSSGLLNMFLKNHSGYGSELTFIKSLDDPNRLSKAFGLGDLVDKQLCYCGDVAKVAITESTCAVLKQLSGGDLVRGEQKYENSFEFTSQAKILLLSNNPLRGAIDDALRDRLVVVPFSQSVPESERILHFEEELYKERGYIFYRYMQALRNLVESNFDFRYVPGSEKWVSGSSVVIDPSVESFVAQMCELDRQASTSVDTLHQAYLHFCDRAQCRPVTDRAQFGKRLRATCPQLKSWKNKAFRGYLGIALRREP